jgi:hypothetical protein
MKNFTFCINDYGKGVQVLEENEYWEMVKREEKEYAMELWEEMDDEEKEEWDFNREAFIEYRLQNLEAHDDVIFLDVCVREDGTIIYEPERVEYDYDENGEIVQYYPDHTSLDYKFDQHFASIVESMIETYIKEKSELRLFFLFNENVQ